MSSLNAPDVPLQYFVPNEVTATRYAWPESEVWKIGPPESPKQVPPPPVPFPFESVIMRLKPPAIALPRFCSWFVPTKRCLTATSRFGRSNCTP